MALPAAVGCWSEVEADVIAALPQLSTFRAFVEAADATEAAAFVYPEHPPDPIDNEAYAAEEKSYDALRHYAVVFSSSSEPFSLLRTPLVAGTSDPLKFDTHGTVYLVLVRTTLATEAADFQAKAVAGRTFKNSVGQILEQLAAYLDGFNGPQLKSVTVEMHTETKVEHREQVGWQHEAGCSIEWGIEA
jgi:hypothetical protein